MQIIIGILLIALLIYVVSTQLSKNKQAGSQKTQKHGSYGKWVGGGLGWAFGGPIGAILGFALGSMFDGSGQAVMGKAARTSREDFGMSLLVLSAAVMRADGKVVKAELDYVKNFLLHQFGETDGQRYVLLLREILKQEFNLQEVCIQIKDYMDYPSRLQLVHYLFGLAGADSNYDIAELDVIDVVSRYMGISQEEFASIRAMFIKNVNAAYDILEITSNATNEEVKKAYRKMALTYHPDKVAHLGDDVKRSAEEKIQRLNAAYEEIKKQRGMI